MTQGSASHTAFSVLMLASFVGLTVTTARADVRWIPPFEGERREGFEHRERPGVPTFCVEGGVFGGAAALCALGDRRSCLITGAWTAHCTTLPHHGAWFFGSIEGGVEYIFERPARRFGGWFTTNTEIGGGVAVFYDANHHVIAERIIEFPPNCEWVWNGWEATNHDRGIARVEIIGNFRIGGHVMMDDMQYDAMGGGGGDLGILVEGMCPGVVEIAVSHATPGVPVYLVWGVGEGHGPIVPGCPDLAINIEAPVLIDIAEANREGVANFRRELPHDVCDRALVQGVEVHTCRKTDLRGF